MKITLNINEEQKDLVFNLLNSNNLCFEVEEDFDVPQWQMDETGKRIKEFEENPDIAIPANEFLGSLRNRVK